MLRRSSSPRSNRKKEAADAASKPLLSRYEPAEPRLLYTGRLGPVLRAKDLQAKTLVALKVFNAAEAFHRGNLPGCRTLPEAQDEVLRTYKAQVRALQRVQSPRDS